MTTISKNFTHLVCCYVETALLKEFLELSKAGMFSLWLEQLDIHTLPFQNIDAQCTLCKKATFGCHGCNECCVYLCIDCVTVRSLSHSFFFSVLFFIIIGDLQTSHFDGCFGSASGGCYSYTNIVGKTNETKFTCYRSGIGNFR